MDDTSNEIRALQQQMWLALPEEERLRRCGEMFAFAKAAAENRAPVGLSTQEKRRFIFRELYGFELPQKD